MKKLQNSVNFSLDSSVPSPSSATIEMQTTVRYSETDQMGVAHNKNYFEWFEIGRTEFCRQKKIPYKDIEKRGFFLVVVEAFCRYKKALRYDETVVIQVTLRNITPKKVMYAYRLLSRDKNQLCAEGYTTHIVTNAKTEVCRLPEDIIDKLKS